MRSDQIVVLSVSVLILMRVYCVGRSLYIPFCSSAKNRDTDAYLREVRHNMN
ncbi:MAG: hypothetical protein ACFE0J_10870 [Elainellaceae cyanobacterium]